MRFVEITHPKAGRAVVPESAVAHHVRAGWARVEKQQEDNQDSEKPRAGKRRSDQEGE